MSRLIKTALIIFMLFIVVGCDNSTSSQNKIDTEKSTNAQSEDCSDDVSSSSYSALEPTVAKGCAIN